MKPFLLLATRAVDVVADAEYAAMLRYSGLDERDLPRVRLEQQTAAMVDPSDYSGIILGGGPFTTSDPYKSDAQVWVEEWLGELLTRVIATDAPFLGACYGIGTVGAHQGGVIDRTYGEPIGAVTVTLTDAGRQDAIFGQLPETFDAFVGHKEAMRDLPDHATHLASSPTCPVQAFRIGDNVYATQFHPELDVAGLQGRIEAYKDYGYFDPADAEALKSSVADANVHAPQILLSAFVEHYQH